ncbi:MAG: flagellar hook-associated protein FlgK [Planctomycetota bacterium]
MTFGFGMGSGLAALRAAQLGMQTAGNNVANANTPGYARQRVELGSAFAYGVRGNLQIGTGVDVHGISRMVDGGLERRIQLQLGLVGAAEVDSMRLREIESIFAEPDEGLSNSFKDLFGALDQLRTDPADRALRGGLVQSGATLSDQFNLLSRRLGDLGASTFDEVRGLTRQVNQHTTAIARLNEQIIATEANGSQANDLRDTRSQHVKELGKLLDTQAIERSTGSLDLLVGGSLVVAGNRATAMRVSKNSAGETELRVGESTSAAQVREGRIAALLRQEQGGLPGYTSRIDELARSTILEWNRIHSTGVPASGPFQSLMAANAAVDGDGDGVIGDELLSQAGFAFPIERGELYVAVTDRATGALERTRIDVDPDAMTLQDLAAELSAVDHLTATVDPTGRLRVNADSGYGFDFSPRLDPNPDGGTFGGLQPTIGSADAGPYDLSAQPLPITLDVDTGAATVQVTLDATDFADPAAATTDELVAAFNADLGSAATATAVGGRLMVTSSQGGSSASLRVSDAGGGAALTALGMTSAAVQGRDHAIDVRVEGTYDGSDNQQFTFVPETSGTIGVSDELRVRVLDQDGQLVTTLDVGSQYQPGEPLSLGNGVQVAFGSGELSSESGQAFALDALADSDTSDVLVATGMNAFFLGASAADMRVNEDLQGNPDRLAAGTGPASGDAGNLMRLVGLRDRDLASLDANTIEDFYADLVGDLGFDTAAARGALDAQAQLLGQLEADRESVSGVNIDEEMVDLLKYQQSYEAAARFISVAQEMTEVLINLGR